MVNDIPTSAATLRNDLTIISNWTFQWKMIFNSDLTKQVQEVIFSRKTEKLRHSSLSFIIKFFNLFNKISLKNSISQEHIGLTLDVKLTFVEQIKKYHSKN